MHYFNVIRGGQPHIRDVIQPNTTSGTEALGVPAKSFTCTIFSKVMQEPSVSDVNQPTAGMLRQKLSSEPTAE